MSNSEEHDQGISKEIDRNIRALLERRARQQKEKGFQDKIADAIGRFTGSMPFVYIHMVIFGLWVLINLGWLPIKPFDPTFVILATVASVEAIFLSTFVLISQNRMAALADDRADLDLAMSLITEHELTRVLTIAAALAKKMDIAVPDAPEIRELMEDVQPEQLLETLRRNKA
jgi:uncharacterized membrane protein